MVSTPKMFQLYVHKDQGLNRSMIERCQAAKFDCIALTVDTIVGGKRERNFGPPAPPKGKRTSQNKGRADAGPKGPIKVRGGGRVYDVDDPAVDAAAPVPFDDFATSLPDDEQATDAVKVADHDKLADELGDE